MMVTLSEYKSSYKYDGILNDLPDLRDFLGIVNNIPSIGYVWLINESIHYLKIFDLAGIVVKEI